MLAVLAAGVLLGGCAPATVRAARKMGPEHRYSFVAPKNYQAVYRKVLEQTRNCHEGMRALAQQVVTGDLYHDTKAGTIVVSLRAGYGVDIFQVIDLQAIDDSHTKLTAVYPLGPVTKLGQTLQQWTLENSTDCDLKT